jgi:hypothetical protein
MRLPTLIALTALAALAALTALACDTSTAVDPAATGARSASTERSASIAGTVQAIRFAPDSTMEPVRAASVAVVRVAELPAPTVIGDSVGYVTPGPFDCGRQAPATATVRTDDRGRFLLGELDAGVYALTVSPPEATALDARTQCPLILAPEAELDLTLYLSPAAATAAR